MKLVLILTLLFSKYTYSNRRNNHNCYDFLSSQNEKCEVYILPLKQKFDERYYLIICGDNVYQAYCAQARVNKKWELIERKVLVAKKNNE